MTSPLTATQFAEAYGLTAPSATAPSPVLAASYKTRYQERWDWIAWTVYGDPFQITTLVQMNPQVPMFCHLPQGTELSIALIAPPASPASSTPWQP